MGRRLPGRRACRLERAHGPDQQEAVAMRAAVLAHEAAPPSRGARTSQSSLLAACYCPVTPLQNLPVIDTPIPCFPIGGDARDSFQPPSELRLQRGRELPAPLLLRLQAALLSGVRALNFLHDKACGNGDNANALPTVPQEEQKQKKRTFDVLPKPDKLIRYRQRRHGRASYGPAIRRLIGLAQVGRQRASPNSCPTDPERAEPLSPGRRLSS